MQDSPKEVRQALNLCFSHETLSIVQNLGLSDVKKEDVVAITFMYVDIYIAISCMVMSCTLKMRLHPASTRTMMQAGKLNSRAVCSMHMFRKECCINKVQNQREEKRDMIIMENKLTLKRLSKTTTTTTKLTNKQKSPAGIELRPWIYKACALTT